MCVGMAWACSPGHSTIALLKGQCWGRCGLEKTFRKSTMADLVVGISSEGLKCTATG
jgi:hypothetical protein